MTLEELVKETLVQKHRRLMQEKCKHDDTIYNGYCLDCVKFVGLWFPVIKHEQDR